MSEDRELAELNAAALDKQKAIASLNIGEAVAVSPTTLGKALGRAGDMIRQRYGEEIFQGALGSKIRQDLVNASKGGSLTLLDKGLLVIASGGKGCLTIQVGFSGEPLMVGVVEGKAGFLSDLGLHLLPGES